MVVRSDGKGKGEMIDGVIVNSYNAVLISVKCSSSSRLFLPAIQNNQSGGRGLQPAEAEG